MRSPGGSWLYMYKHDVREVHSARFTMHVNQAFWLTTKTAMRQSGVRDNFSKRLSARRSRRCVWWDCTLRRSIVFRPWPNPLQVLARRDRRDDERDGGGRRRNVINREHNGCLAETGTDRGGFGWWASVPRPPSNALVVMRPDGCRSWDRRCLLA